MHSAAPGPLGAGDAARSAHEWKGFAKFSMAALPREDTASGFAVYHTAIGDGWLNQDEKLAGGYESDPQRRTPLLLAAGELGSARRASASRATAAARPGRPRSRRRPRFPPPARHSGRWPVRLRLRGLPEPCLRRTAGASVNSENTFPAPQNAEREMVLISRWLGLVQILHQKIRVTMEFPDRFPG